VIIFGHGRAHPESLPLPDCIEPSGGHHGIQLAFMPIIPNKGPRMDGMQFYAGNLSWSPDESDARTLIRTCYYWTSVSAGRLPGTGKWILLYQLSGPAEVPNSHHLPIVARIADQPWELETAKEIPIFDPTRDNAWGHYMFSPNMPNSNRNPPNFGHPAFAYGAFLLHKYTEYDRKRNIVTIYYLMSTGRPYQVQLMRSSIRL
jgi:hypothetical protein